MLEQINQKKKNIWGHAKIMGNSDFSVRKVFSEHSQAYRLHIVYSCFHATMAELSGCDRD